jgi:predicted ester cyclase
MLLQYSLHAPRRGRDDVRNFMMEFRAAFPDLNFWGAADLIAEGDYVVGRWEGGGTHTGPAFSDFLVGSLPAASGRRVRFTGTTVLRVVNGKIAEEIGLDDGVTALQQLGILKAASPERTGSGIIRDPVSAYEMGHGKDKAGAARAPIGQDHVEGSRCARETRVRYPWEAVRADQPSAPPGSSAEAKIECDGRSGNHLQLASAR